MKFYSLFLVIGSLALIALFGGLAIFASVDLLNQLLPDALGAAKPWISWAVAIILIVGLQICECRPVDLRHRHTNPKDLLHQGMNPGENPDVKPLKTQYREEMGMNRRGYIWADTLAQIANWVDAAWSIAIFPPFKAGNDPGKIWDSLLRQGLGAVDWLNLLFIIGNVILIPLLYTVYLNELSILKTGKKDK